MSPVTCQVNESLSGRNEITLSDQKPVTAEAPQIKLIAAQENGVNRFVPHNHYNQGNPGKTKSLWGTLSGFPNS